MEDPWYNLALSLRRRRNVRRNGGKFFNSSPRWLAAILRIHFKTGSGVMRRKITRRTLVDGTGGLGEDGLNVSFG
ncbi:hypothetical protein SLE2022_049910 [Rubroshorea leprosula]